MQVETNQATNVAQSAVEGNAKARFEKQSHLFSHRKAGAQSRFQKQYSELALAVGTAWTADLISIEQEVKSTGKYNQALAATKKERLKQMAEKQAREVLSTVFAEWRREIDRLISDLRGYPQEDGNILFPDGSTARMPKGLYIPPENLLKFN